MLDQKVIDSLTKPQIYLIHILKEFGPITSDELAWLQIFVILRNIK